MIRFALIVTLLFATATTAAACNNGAFAVQQFAFQQPMQMIAYQQPVQFQRVAFAQSACNPVFTQRAFAQRAIVRRPFVQRQAVRPVFVRGGLFPRLRNALFGPRIVVAGF